MVIIREPLEGVMAILLTLHVEPVARGIWCNTCLLPTATTYKVYSLCEIGVFPGTLHTRCARCKAAT